MPDFPSIDAADPSAEQEKANQRALTLGLITGGLGILAQPRYHGEASRIPIARGALQGLNAYEGSLGDSSESAYRNRQLNVEQQRYQSEASQNQQRIGIEQQNADTSAASAKTQEELRREQAQQLEPVGKDYGDPFAPLRKDPRMASALAMIPPDAVADMSRKDIHDLRTELVKGVMTGSINSTKFQPMGDGIHKIVVDKEGNTISDEIIGPNKEASGNKAGSPETVRKDLVAEATKQYGIDPMMSTLRHPMTTKPSLQEYIAQYFKNHGKNLDGTPISGGAEATSDGGSVAGISVGDAAKKSDGSVLTDGPHKLPSGVQFVVKGGKVVSVGAAAPAGAAFAKGPTMPPPPPSASGGAPLPPPPAPVAAASAPAPAPAPMPARPPVAPPVAPKPLPMTPYLANGKPLRNPKTGELVYTDGKNFYRAKSAAGPFIPLKPTGA